MVNSGDDVFLVMPTVDMFSYLQSLQVCRQVLVLLILVRALPTQKLLSGFHSCHLVKEPLIETNLLNANGLKQFLCREHI
jgi:hypothetical protein